MSMQRRMMKSELATWQAPWDEATKQSHQRELTILGEQKTGGHKEPISERVRLDDTTPYDKTKITIDGTLYNDWEKNKKNFLAEYARSNFLVQFLMDPFGKKRDEIRKLRAYYLALKHGPDNHILEHMIDDPLNLSCYQTMLLFKGSPSIKKEMAKKGNEVRREQKLKGIHKSGLPPVDELQIIKSYAPPIWVHPIPLFYSKNQKLGLTLIGTIMQTI